METKKFYERPKAEVIDCELQTRLLAGSGENQGGAGPTPGERFSPEFYDSMLDD